MSNKCCSFELSIHQRMLNKTLANIFNTNKKCFSTNQNIIIISEGSCNTEDLKNGAENSAFITGTEIKGL